jgi:hypothetical protein
MCVNSVWSRLALQAVTTESSRLQKQRSTQPKAHSHSTIKCNLSVTITKSSPWRSTSRVGTCRSVLRLMVKLSLCICWWLVFLFNKFSELYLHNDVQYESQQPQRKCWHRVTGRLVSDVSKQCNGLTFERRMRSDIGHVTIQNETTTLPRTVGHKVPLTRRHVLERKPQLKRC